MRKQYSAVAIAMLSTLAATTAQAQDAARIQTKVLGNDNQPVLVQFNAEGKMAYRGVDAGQVLRQQLALTTADQMVQRTVETDQLGFTHQKFAQYYQGIRVEHADYTVHAKSGVIESISGDFEKVSGLSTTPALNESAALSRALAHVGARQYMWQTNEANAAEFAPQGELVIVRDLRQNAETGPLVLAWKFNVYAAQPISRALIYVDARTGQVVLQDNIIKHAAATGTFATAYSGTRTINDGTTTGGYFLREGTTRGLGIETYNCRKGNSYTSATDFIDADNNWTSAEYNNANFDNVAGDAHVGAQATYDYWKNVHGRNSYDNAGAKIKSYVHFDDVPGGTGYENAYWDGVRMTYGDGASRFRPLTALDVCGHEIGHAVCEKTANLTYANESGAMNEGLSDIWGASIEAYAVSNLGFTSGGVKAKSTWLIGEEIDKQQAALRSMSDPKSLGQPAYYKGQYWAPLSSAPSDANDQGGVHTNSGVLNHWYYILAVGKSGTNEGGNTYSVTGVGIDAAAKITFRMESVYMTASSNYAQARTYAIQAATDLYGAGSAQVIAVTNAWYAVGVGASYTGGGTTPPPTSTTYCTIKGSSQSYEWIDLVQLGSINRTSGKDAGYYNGTALSTSVAAGSSQTVYFSAGFTSTAYTEYWKVYIDYNRNGVFTDAGELVVSGSSASAGTLSATFTVPSTARSGSTVMRVLMSDNSATSSCGTFSYGEAEDYTLNITGGAALTGPTTLAGDATPLGNEAASTLQVYPNPATDALHLVLPGNAEATSVVLSDVRGARVNGATLRNGTLDISGLAKGMYTLSVSDGQKVFHQRFVKE
ncbi:M4 family metallopeptidase [Hymenobacter sp. BT662]|uniref:M4 family metallopeptidase n=2 Tax=Hymenobacter ruricola TaxID=2791023 RepID=A0ABS0IA83_9BACT|nr:M4 family metallopeptidase [Hymenobacter ruricola]